MSNLKSFVAIALIGVVAAPAFATTDFTTSINEGLYKTRTTPASSITRAQVNQELADWSKNPVTAGGLREVGGELGWVQEPQKLVFHNGRFQQADTIGHDSPKSSIVMKSQAHADSRTFNGW